MVTGWDSLPMAHYLAWGFADWRCISWLAIGVLLVVDILHESGISIRAWLAKQVLVIRWSIYMLVLLGFVVLLLQNYGRAAAEFLYFQF